MIEELWRVHCYVGQQQEEENGPYFLWKAHIESVLNVEAARICDI
jgi:hypothetical protein